MRLSYPLEQDMGPLAGDLPTRTARIEELFNLFRGALRVDFRWKEEGPPHTDCETFIAVDPIEPDAYLSAEHELSHWLFGSDPNLMQLTRTTLIDGFLRAAGYTPHTGPGLIYKQELETFYQGLWNLLEDLRVLSWWSDLYEGGGALARRHWVDVAQGIAQAPELGLLQVLCCVLLGVDVSVPAPLKPFLPEIREAAQQAVSTDAIGCVGITTRLFKRLATLLSAPPPTPPAPKPAPLQATTSHGSGGVGQPSGPPPGQPSGPPPSPPSAPPTPPPPGQGTPNPAPSGPPDPVAALSRNLGRQDPLKGPGALDQTPTKRKPSPAQSVLATRIASVQDAATLTQMVAEGRTRMEARMTDLRDALAVCPSGDSDHAQVDRACEKELLDSEDVEGAGGLPPASQGALQLRAMLLQQRRARRNRPAYEGSDLQMDNAIAATLERTQDTSRVFTSPQKGEGVELLALLDISGSMRGLGDLMVNQIIADLASMARAPGITIRVWLYSNTLYRMTRLGAIPDKILRKTTNTVGALRVAEAWALGSLSRRAILLVTDGLPNHKRAVDSKGTALLDTVDTLNALRARKIPLGIVLTGPFVSVDDANAHYGEGMYGIARDLNQLPAAALAAAGALLTRKP